MFTDIKKLDERVIWQDLTPGCTIVGGGTSVQFSTGSWRVDTPVFLEEKCRQCLICPAACPDSAIPIKDGKRMAFDLEHCKGCGICAAVCPFSAIEMREGA